MAMFESILVPLDGSSVAERVLPFVAEFASKMNGQVTLLTACCQDDPLKHLFGSYLSEKAEQLDAQGIGVKSAIVQGDPAEGILDFAEANRVGLIAVCTHGEGGASRWPLGSIAHKILLKSHVPVLLLRSDGDPPCLSKDRYRVLVTLDGSPVSESILPYVEGIAAGAHCEVVLLRIAEPFRLVRVGTYATGFRARQYERDQRELIDHAKSTAQLYLADIEKALAAKGIETKVACVLGKPVDSILQSADDLEADMIALATHGFSGVSRWAFGSVASRIVEGARQSVLVVRPPLPSPMQRRPIETQQQSGVPSVWSTVPSASPVGM